MTTQHIKRRPVAKRAAYLLILVFVSLFHPDFARAQSTPPAALNVTDKDNNSLLFIGEDGNVGIGLTDMLARLHVDGTVRVTGLQFPTNAVAGYLLMSDDQGNASWHPAPPGELVLPFEANTATNTPLFDISQTGLSLVGNFGINNPSNNAPALHAYTTGGGPALMGFTPGTGHAGKLEIQNTDNTSPAVLATTNGLGPAATFVTSNENSTSGAVHIDNNGLNAGIYVFNNNSNNNTETIFGVQRGTGFAAQFHINNAANGYPSLAVSTNGSGPAIQGFANGTGRAGEFVVNNPSNDARAFYTETNGLGPAAFFATMNPGSVEPAVQIDNRGGGPGLFIQNIDNPVSIGPALGAVTSSESSAMHLGVAGEFAVGNPNSAAAAIWAHASGSGSGVLAENEGTGTALIANHKGASGNVAVFASDWTNVARIDKNGIGYFNGGTQNSGADVAEAFEVEGLRATYKPGDVLVISTVSDRMVEHSNSPYSMLVAGVYATKPGVLLTEHSIEENLDDTVPMGIIGVIPTKVSAEGGPIRRGDLLVTSSTSGHAMKADPDRLRFGMVLGKALENFEGTGTGLIKVLVSVK